MNPDVHRDSIGTKYQIFVYKDRDNLKNRLLNSGLTQYPSFWSKRNAAIESLDVKPNPLE